MSEIEYGNVKFSDVKIIGEKVLIEKLQKGDLRQIDGIYIPDSKEYKNSKIGVGRIIGIGNDAKEKYSVNVGDYVLYDYYSAHGDWPDKIITNGENIILQLEEDEAMKFLNSSL